MSTNCRYCGGTGKARRIAVVGDPVQQDQMGARMKIQEGVRPADHVVAFSDFAQMVSAEANHTHARERDKKLEDAGDFDEVIDIGSSAQDKQRGLSEAQKVVQTPGSGNTPPAEGVTPGAEGGGPMPHVPTEEELKRLSSSAPTPPADDTKTPGDNKPSDEPKPRDDEPKPRKSLFSKKSGE